jgi:hypothetical protein
VDGSDIMHAFIASDSALQGVCPLLHDAEGRQSSSFNIKGAHLEDAAAFCTASLHSLSHWAGVSSVLFGHAQGPHLQLVDASAHSQLQEQESELPSPHSRTFAHAA